MGFSVFCMQVNISKQKNEEYKEEVLERFFVLSDNHGNSVPKARAVMVDMEPKVN